MGFLGELTLGLRRLRSRVVNVSAWKGTERFERVNARTLEMVMNVM